MRRLMKRPSRDREQCVYIPLKNFDLLISRTVAEGNKKELTLGQGSDVQGAQTGRAILFPLHKVPSLLP